VLSVVVAGLAFGETAMTLEPGGGGVRVEASHQLGFDASRLPLTG
jgi:hypothetical protein